MRFTPTLLVIPFAFGLAGCSSVYYGTMEMMGKQKREILVDRVEGAREAQGEAKEQFKTALERFTEVTGFQGGELEQKYNELNAAYEASQTKADSVTGHINAIEDVAEAMLTEWEKELEEYTNANLKAASKRKLAETRLRYGALMTAMRRAESKMQPVLSAFHDQVLFLKHNLNAAAVASLQQELDAIELDVAALVEEMEQSIAEADAFLAAIGNA